MFATGFTCTINQAVMRHHHWVNPCFVQAVSLLVLCIYITQEEILKLQAGGYAHLMAENCTWLEIRSHSWFCNQAYLYKTKSSVPCTAGLRLFNQADVFMVWPRRAG